ncbi:MAG TPA: PTS sugar transporter subunit IIA [bacterium]|nr:PTS sugar transporter subunit IIA [bacterium]
MMLRIVVVMHGGTAGCFKEETEKILGSQEEFYAFSLERGDSPDDIYRELSGLIREGESIILVDFPGGTPCNCALKIFREFPNVDVISGVNLPMLFTALTARKFKTRETVVQMICEDGRKSIRFLSGEVRE